MEVFNQEIVFQIIALLFAPLALIIAATLGVALVTGVAGRVVLLVEDLANLREARRLTAQRVPTVGGPSRTPVRA